ncbi:hypothetical protein GOP47_0007782 [Adiantum capillus-veneris]|uniref:Nucleotide-diphospho-sugar transferase domain-containing protein n=1 Tax=Adiantum capillus-veneris TaxID=13818 RepID=A0A9D4V2A1_ADICA|nr:hypothetical protein GOP47_0007782 [Adiantum capillus-veneris]
MKECRRQTLQVALHAIWIAGLLCIVVSLYATQLLLEQKVGVQNGALRMTQTYFTVPAPFEGNVGAYQAQAIHSWLRLSSHLQVVLLGRHPSLTTFAEKMGGRVMVDSDIDFTFSGAPLFNSIMARASSSTSEISVLIDPQFLLMKDFLDTLEHAHSLQHSWLLVAGAKSLQALPFTVDILNDRWVNGDHQTVQNVEVHAYARRLGSWEGCTGRYLLAWSTENVPLHAGVLPSFVYGFGFHHEWLLHEALSSGTRFVFDASEAISAFYLTEPESNHPYDKGGWEADNNAHLAALYGSFYFRPADFVNTPVKLIRCGNPDLKAFQFLYPWFGMKTSNEDRSPSMSGHDFSETEDFWSQFQPWNKGYLTSFRRFARQSKFLRYPCLAVEARIKDKGSKSLSKKLMSNKLRVGCDCSNVTQGALDCPSSKMRRLPKYLLDRSSSKPLPLTLKSLLAIVSGSSNTVVLSVVGNNYKDMLMNWVCRLRKLQVTSFIIGAVDTQLYEFGLLQGLPVFMIGPGMDLGFNDCHFGTECFKKVTKMKSRMVLDVLRLGYRVLFSDVDVYWFRNPMEYLMSFGPRTIVAQSDQWNATEAPNKPRRLNSGFYFVWPDASTVAAFEMIVKHASMSNMSEQPSFYDVLCGESGRHRLGDSMCLEPETNVTTHFLDRELFPNGAFKDLWERRNTKEIYQADCLRTVGLRREKQDLPQELAES